LGLVQLSGCGLTALPTEIGDMAGLKKLNAAQNRLASLPPSFANLKELRTAFFLGCEFEVRNTGERRLAGFLYGRRMA
jgi:hypothetical protein